MTITASGYTTIIPNNRAFTALKSDGTVSSWGGATFGGNGAPTVSGYITVKSTGFAFAAMKPATATSVSDYYYPTGGAKLVSIPSLLPPTNISISGGRSQIFINFTSAANATSYKVLYGISGAGSTITYDLSQTITSTGQAITNLSGGTYYSIQVAASNGSTLSAYSAAYKIRTIPSTPQDISMTGNIKKVNISFAQSNGSTSYTIKYKKASASQFTSVSITV